MREKTIRVVLAAVTAVAVAPAAGCSKKALSREEADRLLANALVAAREEPRCSVHLPGAWIESIGPLTLNNEGQWAGCVEALQAAQLIDKVHCVESGSIDRNTYNKCRASLASGVTMKCASRSAGAAFLGRMPSESDCTAYFACGEAKVTVDSITTEEKSATIRFTVAKSLDERFKQKWPASCEPDTSFRKSDARTAKAARTDEGGWVLEK
jgi:hypothetical protein